MKFFAYLLSATYLGCTAREVEPAPTAIAAAPTRPPSALVTSTIRRAACDCNGALVNERCYSSLEEAVDEADNDDHVFIGGTHYIYDPIRFRTNLNFVGVKCSGDRAKLVAKFDYQRRAILEATNWDEQIILLANLDFTGTYGNSNSGFHTRGKAGASGGQRIALGVYNTRFYKMSSKRDGAGIFVGVADALTISSDCTFENLKAETGEKGVYAGGPALTIAYVPPYSTIDIDGDYIGNSARFIEGSKHSDGGAMHFSTVEGVVNLQGYFEDNKANQGGALFVEELNGTMYINGIFEDNQAVDDDFGARGGVLRFVKLFPGSELQVAGKYKNNRSDGKGAVIALNVIADKAIAYISGRFEDNRALGEGGIVSVWSSTEMKGTLIIDNAAKFWDNDASNDKGEPSSNILYVEKPRTYYSEGTWSGSRVIVGADQDQVLNITPKKW